MEGPRPDKFQFAVLLPGIVCGRHIPTDKTRGRRPTQERLPLVLFRAVAEQPNLETQ